VELAVAPEHLLPRRRARTLVEDIPEPPPDVAGQQPRTLVRDHLRQRVRAPLREQRGQRWLERVARRVVLEPEQAVRGRNARDRRPRPRTLELDLRGPLDVRVDPRGRALEPVRLLPGKA
jgi:hypothetical protein